MRSLRLPFIHGRRGAPVHLWDHRECPLVLRSTIQGQFQIFDDLHPSCSRDRRHSRPYGGHPVVRLAASQALHWLPARLLRFVFEDHALSLAALLDPVHGHDPSDGPGVLQSILGRLQTVPLGCGVRGVERGQAPIEQWSVLPTGRHRGSVFHHLQYPAFLRVPPSREMLRRQPNGSDLRTERLRA